MERMHRDQVKLVRKGQQPKFPEMTQHIQKSLSTGRPLSWVTWGLQNPNWSFRKAYNRLKIVTETRDSSGRLGSKMNGAYTVHIVRLCKPLSSLLSSIY
jgi:hypothetical protein